MSDIKLNLNDFKAVLGQVNDGNVRVDERGKLVKVNYGGAITSFFRAHVTVSPGENANLRKAFMAAIIDSREGRTLQKETLDGIRRRLGIGTNEFDKNGQLILEKDLTRHDIHDILMDVTGESVHGGGRYEAIINQDVEVLRNRGLLSEQDLELAKNFINGNPVFSSSTKLAEFVKSNVYGDLFGFSAKDIVKFARNNAAQLKEIAFCDLYMRLHDARAVNVDSKNVLDAVKPRGLLFKSILRLMTIFARHGEATLRFGTIVPLPKNAGSVLETQNQNGNLAPLKDQLDKFDSFVDRLFPTVASRPGRPIPVKTLSVSSANTALKLQIRKEILDHIELNGGELERARNSEGFRTIKGLLLLSGESLELLSEKAKTILRERFFRAAADVAFRDGQRETTEIFRRFAEILKPITDALDPETHLKAAYSDAGCDDAMYEQLRSCLMKEGALNENCASLCRTMCKEMISRFSGLPERPGAEVTVSNEYMQARSLLAGAFSSERDSLIANDRSRRELIESFRTEKDECNFPAYINDDSHKALRSKLFLMATVLTREQCRDAGLPVGKVNLLKLEFECLKDLKVKCNDRSKMTAQFLGDNHLTESMDEELRRIEAKLDELLKSVPAQEIIAQKKYYDLGGYAAESCFGGGKTWMLDAMRDRLIPENIGAKAFLRFVEMFYAAYDPNQKSRSVHVFHVNELKSLGALEAEYFVTIKAATVLEPKMVSVLSEMLKNGLSEIDSKSDQDEESKKKAKIECYRSVIDRLRWEQPYSGFGSQDVVAVFKLLGRCGIDISKMTTEYRLVDGEIDPPDLDRALALTQLIKLRGGNADGIVEYFERVTGKPITCLSRKAVLEAQQTFFHDPLDDIKEDTALGKVSRFFTGKYSVEQTGLSAAERVQFWKELGNLSKCLAGDMSKGTVRTVTLNGVEVKISIDTRFRQLTASVVHEKRSLPIAYPFDIGDLDAQLQNAIIANIEKYLDTPDNREMLLQILPDADMVRSNISRAREICTRVISRITGRASVDFAAYTIDQLRESARNLIVGSISKESLAPELSQSYNSQEAIELGTSLLADESMMQKISWVTVTDPIPPPGQREDVRPSDSRIRDFAADLVMNRNTWTFDVGNRLQPGERILALLKGYAPEVRYLMKHPEAFETLEETVRDSVKAIVEGLVAIVPDIAEPEKLESLVFAEHAQKLAQIENDVKTMVATAMASLQKMIEGLFPGRLGSDKKNWQRTTSEINGTGGLDLGTSQGRFIKGVLDSYFVKSSEIDQRAMLSAFIRNTGPGDTDGKRAGELIKGAGPLLQKMLQGLPVETFPPETRAALEDTRSNLAPIPREVVNARLANMITSSNGFITKIEVRKSLGAASVAEALLCRIYTKDRPVTGEEVVIKILRPNVETAVRREYRIISEIARNPDVGTGKAFEDRYRGILEEFDFTIESGNIDRGAVYNHPKVGYELMENIEAMGRYHPVLPTTGAVVLRKAEGKPFSNYTRDMRAEMDGILDGCRTRVSTGKDGATREVVLVNGGPADVRVKRMQLDVLHSRLIKRREQLTYLVRAWFQQAFEGGFIHGDMHSGNIMTSEHSATIIDFGNCTFLSEKDRNALLVALSACVFGEAVAPANPGGCLLDCIRTLSDPSGQAEIDRAKKDTKLIEDLRVALTRGTKMDVVTRLLSSLTFIQNRGYSLPPSITVFTQSLSRLQAAIADTDELLSQIEGYADAVEPHPDLVEKFTSKHELTEKFKYFANLDKYLVKAMGGRGKSSENDPQLLKLLDPRCNTGVNVGDVILQELRKDDDKGLLERNGGLDFINMVLNRYNGLARPCRIEHNGGERTFSGVDISDQMSSAIEAHRKLVEGNALQDDIVASRDKLHRDLLAEVARYAREFCQKSDSVSDYDSMSLTFEQCGFMALKTVLNGKLGSGSFVDASNNAMKLFKGAMGDKQGGAFASEVGLSYRTYFNRVELESANIRKVRTCCSDHTDGRNFVSRRNRYLLQRMARDFLNQPGGITKDNVMEIIDANLEVARKKLGRESLTVAEIRYFAMMIDQHNWKPVFKKPFNSYESPFLKLGAVNRGAAVFMKNMLERQNEYLKRNGHADLETTDDFNEEDEARNIKRILDTKIEQVKEEKEDEEVDDE